VTDSLRKKLEQLVQDGEEAKRTLGRLEVIDRAASKDASLADIKAAAAACDAEGDFHAASALKGEWIVRLKRGEE